MDRLVLHNDPIAVPKLKAAQPAWRNRIVGHGEEQPALLAANPRNWRVHSKEQTAALSGSLAEVGWVQSVIVNRQSGFVVDGHLRVATAAARGEKTIPVVYVDLDEREEALILSTLDPLAAMATTDQAMLDSLLKDLTTNDGGLADLLASLATPNFEPVGEDEQGRLDEKAAISCPECGARFTP